MVNYELQQLVEKFLSTGEKYAKIIDLPEDETVRDIYCRLHSYFRHHKDCPVTVRQRGEKLYLERLAKRNRK